MNTLTIVGLCAIPCIVGLGAFYRYKKVSWMPFGTGFGIDSPDGRYRAHAADYIDESFGGLKTQFYGFEVTDRGTGETIARHETPRVASQETADRDVDFCSEVVVTWASDSQRVRVEFRGKILWEYEITHAA
jgi:hypothetical protein